MARQINELGLELLTRFEECHLKAYQGKADPPGMYTIGYGHVLTGHEEPDLFKPGQLMKDVTITQERAEELLNQDLENKILDLGRALPKGFLPKSNDDQFSALVCFIYNIGYGGFLESFVRRELVLQETNLNFDGVSKYFRGFIKSHGADGFQIRRGLIRRRASEAALFDSDYENLKIFWDKTKTKPKDIKLAKQYLGLE